MLSTASVVLSAALLAAMVLNLLLSPALSKKITTGCMLIAVVSGLLCYGIGYAQATGSLSLCLIRTPMTVIRMFLGVNDLDGIKDTFPVSTQGGIVFFWFIHLLAFYSMASAAMYTLGAEALRALRIFMAQRGDLTLIYGINDASIALGKECVSAGERSVMFLADSADAATISDLNSVGMSVMTGLDAVAASGAFLKKLRLRKRKLTVYAMDSEADRDLFFALRLKEGMEKLGVPARQTRLTLPGAEDILMPMLQVSESAYGFGHVNVFDPADLTARALIRTCPPWDFMHFDKDGCATENFECVIAGFGSHGQAVLKSLVMNGQFVGSRFSAVVFSPNVENETGFLEADCPELLNHYDIRLVAADAQSNTFFRFIESHLSTLKMVAICTGDEDRNREITERLMLFLQRRHAENICVVQCGEAGVRFQDRVGSPIIRTDIHTRVCLSAEVADRLAILLNATYDGSNRTDWEKWVSCDSFSKMSSRASADFMPAFIRISGSSRESILAGEWRPAGRLLQVLGETEHLRWCAFHYAMGYAPMGEAEFQRNAEEYRRQEQAGQPVRVRISKNPEARTHACLIPWEELDHLSARENAITGRQVDYKQIDINNVLALPKLLRAELDARRGKA